MLPFYCTAVRGEVKIGIGYILTPTRLPFGHASQPPKYDMNKLECELKVYMVVFRGGVVDERVVDSGVGKN